MSNFITNLFPGGKHDGILPVASPPLHTRTSQDRPNTPQPRNNFITPASTPQGSPSKNRNPPGANDLPTAFESSMKINPGTFGSPTKGSPSKIGRPLFGPPLSPGKGNSLGSEDYFGNSTGNRSSEQEDSSVLHKSVPGSPLRRGKENAEPSLRPGDGPPQNQAAISRQEPYQSRDTLPPASKKYNTQRGLTPEELEILHKPNVKRLANVTQLCKSRAHTKQA